MRTWPHLCIESYNYNKVQVVRAQRWCFNELEQTKHTRDSAKTRTTSPPLFCTSVREIASATALKGHPSTPTMVLAFPCKPTLIAISVAPSQHGIKHDVARNGHSVFQVTRTYALVVGPTCLTIQRGSVGLHPSMSCYLEDYSARS
jgi:hypothetical protein